MLLYLVLFFIIGIIKLIIVFNIKIFIRFIWRYDKIMRKYWNWRKFGIYPIRLY